MRANLSKHPGSTNQENEMTQVNGMYNPMGLVSLFIVYLKIILCKLWGQDKKLDWDDPIPDRLRHDWVTFFE